MATLKDAFPWPELAPGMPSRGRNDYSRLGVLRTKPGRADAPSVISMSCSDKIARWCVLGVQGSLVSNLTAGPVYLDNIIIGDVEEDMRNEVNEDCERAFWRRLGDIEGMQHNCLQSIRNPLTFRRTPKWVSNHQTTYSFHATTLCPLSILTVCVRIFE